MPVEEEEEEDDEAEEEQEGMGAPRRGICSPEDDPVRVSHSRTAHGFSCVASATCRSSHYTPFHTLCIRRPPVHSHQLQQDILNWLLLVVEPLNASVVHQHSMYVLLHAVCMP